MILNEAYPEYFLKKQIMTISILFPKIISILNLIAYFWMLFSYWLVGSLISLWASFLQKQTLSLDRYLIK